MGMPDYSQGPFSPRNYRDFRSERLSYKALVRRGECGGKGNPKDPGPYLTGTICHDATAEQTFCLETQTVGVGQVHRQGGAGPPLPGKGSPGRLEIETRFGRWGARRLGKKGSLGSQQP